VDQLVLNAFDPQNELALRWAALRPFLSLLCATLRVIKDASSQVAAYHWPVIACDCL
jgi:hypothetical protein